MKTCIKCRIDQPLENFCFKNKLTRTLQNRCRDCQNKYSHDHYLRNKEKHLLRKAVRRKKEGGWTKAARKVWEYLSLSSCVDCGEDDSIVLEFDHIIGDKKDNISDMVRRGSGWGKVLEEINKCVVRCANCHRRKTAVQFGWRVVNGPPPIYG